MYIVSIGVGIFSETSSLGSMNLLLGVVELPKEVAPS